MHSTHISIRMDVFPNLHCFYSFYLNFTQWSADHNYFLTFLGWLPKWATWISIEFSSSHFCDGYLTTKKLKEKSWIKMHWSHKIKIAGLCQLHRHQIRYLNAIYCCILISSMIHLQQIVQWIWSDSVLCVCVIVCPCVRSH